jgi:hypothetical protein
VINYPQLGRLEGSIRQNIDLHKQTVENIANINSENFKKSFSSELSDAEINLKRESALDEELKNLKAIKLESLMRLWTLRYQDLRKVVTLGKG